MRMEPLYVKRRQRAAAVVITALVLLIGALIHIGVSVINRPDDDYKGQGEDIALVVVEDGATMLSLGSALVDAEIVASVETFNQIAAADERSVQLQPGVYRLHTHISAAAAVEALLDTTNMVDRLEIPGGSTLMDVTVVGGPTRAGIYSEISKISCGEGSPKCLDVAELQHVAATASMDELGVPEWARERVLARGEDPRRLEGLIVPGQYVVVPGHDAVTILRNLITRSETALLRENLTTRAAQLNLHPYDLLTAASLVERESPAGDFDKVARVILNRLALPMRLEFDSTVNYDLLEVEIATTDEDRARPTAWNTYQKDGLPETPIASPSMEAISAMEHPAEGDWLFFVTIDKDGRTVFTSTHEDHLIAVEESIANGVLDSNR
ncbi:endolytic transglycosylase MltG [Corynebacterium sp. HS2168-gen11]|uniref:endolytic transglycosylase MltG n=1 Tax=Corynebacterium sp. HS2168-gen11 TaxID=2974027 RepID=UPI00216B49B1|nr:endolytic transglycosylase MltG [Corynebacterium sp. HS2168-gen11]MCS4535173.1 endolytic transglycosylase MltG [Corynebacterium sp. HS2168-gen11]